MTMVPDIHWGPLLAAAIYSVLGLVILAVAFFVWEKVTPYSLWKELLEEHNTALAIVVAAMVLAVGMIVSSAIR